MIVPKYENILDAITTKNRVPRILLVCIGSFIASLVYNAFVVPNNLVYGGIGGLAILVHNLFGISTTLFINIVTTILILISFLLLGRKKTLYSVVGFLIYTIMINITSPLAALINIKFDSFLVSILFYSILSGFGFGLIYRTGFNTGGSDSIVAIVQHYLKIPTGQISTIINGIIIVLGAATFGVVNSIYAIIFLKVSNFISDRTILGVSSNKICFIKTKKIHQIEEFLRDELELGYTLIDSTNGIGIFKKTIIMCVIPSDRFYDLKNELLTLDKTAELISNDCYTVEGGHTNKLIPV